MITLYQFQFSHFCEKARWALDYKGVPFRRKNLLPGPHLKTTKKLAPKSCVPIIVDGLNVVQDSSAIIDYLDRTHPQPALTPEDPKEAHEARELEAFFDEEIGVTLRLWFYYYALPDRARATRFMLEGAPWYGRPLLALIFPNVRAAMIKHMGINGESARRSEERLLAALARLDGALSDRRFLVGDRFSRADLTACALLSPVCATGKSDAALSASFPEPVYALREQLKARPFFDWVKSTYAEFRLPAPG